MALGSFKVYIPSTSLTLRANWCGVATKLISDSHFNPLNHQGEICFLNFIVPTSVESILLLFGLKGNFSVGAAIHLHLHLGHLATYSKSSLGFSILPKDTLTCSSGELNQQPSNNKTLYLMSHSRPNLSIYPFIIFLGSIMLCCITLQSTTLCHHLKGKVCYFKVDLKILIWPSCAFLFKEKLKKSFFAILFFLFKTSILQESQRWGNALRLRDPLSICLRGGFTLDRF